MSLPLSALLLLAASTDSLPCSSSVRELRVRSDAGHVIAAQLALPAGRARSPVVIMIGGAGPQDRDYSTVVGVAFANHFFAAVEARLLCAGIGALRFDEVGTGKSTGSYADATTMTLAGDVTVLVDALRRTAGVDSTRIALLGHSEGGAIAGIVASRRPAIAAVILLGAPVQKGEDIMRFQIGLETRRSAADGEVARREHVHRSATDRWYQFFLRFSPASFYARLRQPTLILQGELDDQVSAEQADSILHLARSAGNPFAYCRRYPKHWHSFVGDVPRMQSPAIDVLDDITRFARSVLVEGRPPRSDGVACRREVAGPFSAGASGR